MFQCDQHEVRQHDICNNSCSLTNFSFNFKIQQVQNRAARIVTGIMIAPLVPAY